MALPQQVSPPQLALSSASPTGVIGADVVAVPLLLDGEPADGESAGPTLGPGAAELLDEIDIDVFTLLEHHRATGKVGEVVEHPLLSTAQNHRVIVDAIVAKDVRLARKLITNHLDDAWNRAKSAREQTATAGVTA